MTIIQAYDLKNVSTDDEELEFYNYLQETLDEIPRHDIKLLIGDLNAQIERNRQGRECVIGPHGSRNWATDNGELLMQLYTLNRLCIGNTYFKHKYIRKET